MSHDIIPTGAPAPKNHHIESFVHLFGEHPEDILGCLREGEEQLDGILEFLNVIDIIIGADKDALCALYRIKNLIPLARLSTQQVCDFVGNTRERALQHFQQSTTEKEVTA